MGAEKCFFCGDFVRETDGICILTGKLRCSKHECREKAVEWAREMRAEFEAKDSEKMFWQRYFKYNDGGGVRALNRIADALENIERHMAFNNGTLEGLTRSFDPNLLRR